MKRNSSLAFLLALALSLSLCSCGEKPQEGSSADPGADSEINTAAQENENGQNADEPEDETGETVELPEGAIADETKLGEAVSYYVDGDTLYLKIKTSAKIDVRKMNFDIVNPGFYLTRDSEFITQSIFGDFRCFAEEFDKEWFDGVYVFKFDNDMITGLASDESEWAPGTWSMLMYDSDTGLVIGQWFIVLEGGGKYHFEYKDSWLLGAGEDKEVEEFDSLEKELEACFRFVPEETTDDWATFDFDGYYLEETDPEGYDGYYLMVCPEGDYTTYEDADAVDLTYAGVGVFAHRTCPYRFAFEQYGIEPGKYTMVLAKMGGDVEVQFTAEKKSPTDWKLDFSEAKCPVLGEKYAEAE